MGAVPIKSLPYHEAIPLWRYPSDVERGEYHFPITLYDFCVAGFVFFGGLELFFGAGGGAVAQPTRKDRIAMKIVRLVIVRMVRAKEEHHCLLF